MTPKVVRLQMSPPSLTFLREMRFSADVVIRLTPRATGEEVVHRRGHVFILSDLFLVCERMTKEEKANTSRDGPDMWLLFPPLAGKVLRVSESDRDDTMQVLIMRKETLLLQADSSQARNTLLSEFRECIAFAGSLPPPSKEAQPPLPPLPGVQRSPSTSLPSPNRELGSDAPPMPTRASASSDIMGPPSQRSSSNPPSVRQSNDQLVIPPRRFDSQNQTSLRQPHRLNSASSPNLVSTSEAQAQQELGRIPSFYDPFPGPMHPSRTSSATQAFPGQGLSFTPGQVVPAQSSLMSIHEDPSLRSNPGHGSHPNKGRGGPPPSFHQPLPSHLGNQQLPPPHQNPYEPAQGDPGPHGPLYQTSIHQTSSSRSLNSQYEQGSQGRLPRLPPSGGYPNPRAPPSESVNSFGSLRAPQPRTLLPSVQMNVRSVSMATPPSFTEPSPPNSPVEETHMPTGPLTSTISAQMKCKVFLKREHAQWRSLGSAKLKLYRQSPTNVKQLVVEADDRQKSVLISTIVLTDGVERVGKTGVAVELSDKGTRTGIVYMIQLRNEESAGGLFDSLLAGSDRAGLSIGRG